MCNHIPDGVVVILVSTELGSPKTFIASFIMCVQALPCGYASN